MKTNEFVVEADMELPKLEDYLSETQWLRSLIQVLREYKKELPAWEKQTPTQKRIEAQVMHILVLCYVLEELEKPDDKTKQEGSEARQDGQGLGRGSSPGSV